jgi:hypothetical protein
MGTAPADLKDAVGVFNGKPCKNLAADVRLVKQLLNAHGSRIGLKVPLDVQNPFCGETTRKAIEDFQRIVMGKKPPYGRVVPLAQGGTTYKALLAAPAGVGAAWSGDSSKWPQDKKLRSMNSHFRQKVEKVLTALKAKGFQPKIAYGWRSVAVQLELYKKGVSKVKFSFHNAQTKDGAPNAYAADIIDERWAWGAGADTNGFWKALGAEGKARGLVWGGDWTKPYDPAHVQYYPNSSLAQVKKDSGL